MVVVKDLINSRNILVLILNISKLSVLYLFSVIFDICMERTWIRESSFNLEKGYEDVEGMGLTFCVCSGALKNR